MLVFRNKDSITEKCPDVKQSYRIKRTRSQIAMTQKGTPVNTAD